MFIPLDLASYFLKKYAYDLFIIVYLLNILYLLNSQIFIDTLHASHFARQGEYSSKQINYSPYPHRA